MAKHLFRNVGAISAKYGGAHRSSRVCASHCEDCVSSPRISSHFVAVAVREWDNDCPRLRNIVSWREDSSIATPAVSLRSEAASARSSPALRARRESAEMKKLSLIWRRKDRPISFTLELTRIPLTGSPLGVRIRLFAPPISNKEKEHNATNCSDRYQRIYRQSEAAS